MSTLQFVTHWLTATTISVVSRAHANQEPPEMDLTAQVIIIHSLRQLAASHTQKYNTSIQTHGKLQKT